MIKNRGNYLQWAALDDILDPARYQPWHDFTAELIEYAHARGVRVGLNMQLFGASNLQLAFDLVDDNAAPIAPQVAERLPLLTAGLPFDVYDLSFGEFFDADPQAFIDAVNEVRAAAPRARAARRDARADPRRRRAARHVHGRGPHRRDTAIDAGRQLGIVSQPDRVTFDDLAAGADPAAFATNVLQPLAVYADKLDAIELGPIADDRWGNELRDGLAIDRLRARFVLATYGATLAHLAGDDALARRRLDEATRLFADASDAVARRHRDLHDDHGRRLVDATTNRTFYQFGYLFMADTLCYWDRELVQVGGILGSTSKAVPSCLF